MLLQQSVEHVSIVYTCNTYFVMHWSMLFIRQYLVSVLIQYHLVKNVYALKAVDSVLQASTHVVD